MLGGCLNTQSRIFSGFSVGHMVTASARSGLTCGRFHVGVVGFVLFDIKSSIHSSDCRIRVVLATG